MSPVMTTASVPPSPQPSASDINASETASSSLAAGAAGVDGAAEPAEAVGAAGASPKPLLQVPLESAFEVAVRHASAPAFAARQLTNSQKMRVYGLYKQVCSNE